MDRQLPAQVLAKQLGEEQGHFASTLKARLGAPVVCSLQGEDLFLDALEEPYRTRAFAEVWSTASRDKRSLRSAAYATALRRLEEAALAHGTRDYFRPER